MPADTHAVFLSYAREDTEAARRIADALRGFGVEVWFDQSELRGGDAWDQKIRGQIKDCTLFVPIISAHTEARGEGYFRLEWKLADERTNLIAKGVPFLVPVVVDGTSDGDAMVPDSFRAVQWTRLPDGAPTPQFVAQVKRLLDAPRKSATAKKSDLAASPASAAPVAAKSGFPLGIVGALGAVVVVLVAFIVFRPGPKEISVVPAAAKTVAETKAAPAALAAPTVNEKSIAVLPFDNRSAEKENAFFTDGVHEDILTTLGNIRDLRVISRTSVMEYRGTTKKIPQIAKELGVAFVLEGSVQRSGNTVRITGQLIRAANEGHVWAKNYDRELTAANVFAIQSELAQAIAGELQAAISPQEKTQLERAPTANLAAYELYAKAREIFYARGADIPAMFREATPLWERAVELDPKFADAWVGVSAAYSLAYNRGIERTPAAKAKAHDAIQTALRLAPENPGVILNLARYYTMVEGDFERALVESERAARISPNNAELYSTLGSIYIRQNRAPETLAAARKAFELNPRSVTFARSLATELLLAWRFTEAEKVLRQGLVVQPDSLELGGLLASLPLWSGGSSRGWDTWLASVPPPSRTDGAFRTVHLAVAAAKGDAAEYAELVVQYGREANAPYGYLLALMLSGQTERARTAATRIRDEQLAILAREPNDAAGWGRLAFAYVALGEKSSAMDAADKSVARANTPNQTLPPPAVALRHAQLLAWIDRKDEAVKELAQIWWQPMTQGRDVLTSFMWKPLQGDPRFEAIRNDLRNNAPLF